MNRKQAYPQKLRAQLDEWQARIHTMEAQAKHADAGLQIDYHDQIEDLKARCNAAKAKLDELDAARDTGNRIATGVIRAWKKIGRAVGAASARLK